jgi:catechol 2,3-dioxygenase-like lactoylglutathione lyase family enzyme
MTTVNVRYMVDDVEAAIPFYTTHLGFTLMTKTLPAFADVARGDLRLLLSGPTSSAGRPMPDGRRAAPGGWNRVTSSSMSSLAKSTASASRECASATIS